MNRAARKIVSIAAAAALAAGGIAAAGLISRSPAPAESSVTDSAAEFTVTLDIDFSEVLTEENYARLDPNVKSAANLPESGSFAHELAYTAAEGASALDILEGYCSEKGITLDVRRGSEALGMSDYVRGIGGLSEWDCTRNSGWIYLLDGVEPDLPMSEVFPKEGQRLEIRYIVY